VMEEGGSMDILEQQLLYDDPSRFTSRGKYIAKEMSELPEQDRENLEKFANTDDPAMKNLGATMAQPYGVFPTSLGRAGEQKTSPSLLGTYGDENLGRPTEGEQQFRNMLLGVQGQWIDAYASNVIEKGDPAEIQRLADRVEKHITKNAKKYGGTLDFSEGAPTVYTPRGQTRIEQFSGGDRTAGGQSVQEFAAIKAGIATGEYGVEGLSKAIDLRFRKEIKFMKDSNVYSAGHRMDVTTEFFRDKDHHGIGKQIKDGKKMPVLMGVAETEKWIADYYNDDRIPKFNALMKLVKEATGTEGRMTAKKMHKARQEMGGVKKAHESLKGGSLSPKAAQRGAAAKAVLGLYDTVGAQLLDDLTWVMHHMGNQLTPDGTDPYSNMMPIAVTGPDGVAGVGTLFVVFGQDKNGFYNDMDADLSDGLEKGMGYVHIENDIPIQWLYNKAHDEGWAGTFEEFADMGSAAIVEHTLHEVIQSGTLHKLQFPKTQQRLIYSKISEPEVAETLARVSDKLFETIGDKLGEDLDEQIHNDAVSFSVQSRNPSQMAEIKKWYDFAVDYLMTRDAAFGGEELRQWAQREYSSSDPHGGYEAYERTKKGTAEAIKQWEGFGIGSENRTDPFWYLWAAPYVTRSRPRIGGSVTGHVGSKSE